MLTIMSGLWKMGRSALFAFCSCIFVHTILQRSYRTYLKQRESVPMDRYEVETTISQLLLFDLFSLTREKNALFGAQLTRQTNGRSILTTCTNNEVVGRSPWGLPCFPLFSPVVCRGFVCLFVLFALWYGWESPFYGPY